MLLSQTSELMRELNAACNLRELRLGEVHVPVTSASGLLTKLEYASVKLAEGKNADAIQKLTNFRDTVTALNAQGKINPDDANTLIIGANDAILHHACGDADSSSCV